MAPRAILCLVVVLGALTACDLQRPALEGEVASVTQASSARCAEFLYAWNWICRVAEAAGYRVVGDTQSALLARGYGAEFYIWTTPLTRSIEQVRKDESWSRIARVDDSFVFGDRALWRFWTAQGHIVWLHAGPREHSKLPSMHALAPLVESSRKVPPG